MGDDNDGDRHVLAVSDKCLHLADTSDDQLQVCACQLENHLRRGLQLLLDHNVVSMAPPTMVMFCMLILFNRVPTRRIKLIDE